MTAKKGPPTWLSGALAAADGTQTGAILRAALGLAAPPGDVRSYGRHGTVTSDGFVMADYHDSQGRFHHGAFVGAVDDLTDNVRGLAAHLCLTAEERRQLYEVIQAWITTDYRSRPGLQFEED